MYTLSDEMLKLLKFDVLKILDSCKHIDTPAHHERDLQNATDYFAQSFLNPQDYFFFRFRRVYLAIVLTRQTYHVLCENYRPRNIPQSDVTSSHLLAKNLFGDYIELKDAFIAFRECVIDVLNMYLNIPQTWQQLELY